MKQDSIRFAGLTAVVITLAVALSSAALAETQDEIRGKYYMAMMCGTYMSAFAVHAQLAKEKELEAAFEAATERTMRETVSLGAKLGISQDKAIEEFKHNAFFYARAQPSYSAREVEQQTKFCAPEILPLLK